MSSDLEVLVPSQRDLGPLVEVSLVPGHAPHILHGAVDGIPDVDIQSTGVDAVHVVVETDLAVGGGVGLDVEAAGEDGTIVLLG